MHAPTTPLRDLVQEVVNRTPVYDIHTHLYDPAFSELLRSSSEQSAVILLDRMRERILAGEFAFSQMRH